MNTWRIGFDLDGTILDSRFRHQKVLFDCMSRLNPKTSLEDLSDFVAFKSEGYNTLSYLNYKSITNKKYLNESWKERIELDRYLMLDKLYPYILETLERLKKKNEIVLVTARGNKSGLFDQLQRLGVYNLFDEIIIVKPGEGSGIEKFTRTANLDLKYVFGDTEIDMEWAQNLEAHFIALDCGFRSKDFWRRKGVHSYSSLVEAVKIMESD